MDIFDEDDLLAIAQDAAQSQSDSSPSRALSPSSQSPSDNNGDGDQGGGNWGDIAEDSADYRDGNDHHQRPCRGPSGIAQSRLHEVEPTEEVDDSSDDDDGGLFDQLMAGSGERSEVDHQVYDDNTRQQPHADEINGIHQQQQPEEDDCQGLDASSYNDTPPKELKLKANQVEIKLGNSAMQRISTYQSEMVTPMKKWNVPRPDDLRSIVGIQRDKGSCNASTLHMTLRTGIAPSVGTRDASTINALFTEAADDEADVDNPTMIDPNPSRGQVIIPKESLNSRSLVDCVARYDAQAGCYVLEVVHMNVANVVPGTLADVRRPTAGQGEQRIVDPRVMARQAEGLLRQMRKKKRRGDPDAPTTKRQRGACNDDVGAAANAV
jgi:hypothetical protein